MMGKVKLTDHPFFVQYQPRPFQNFYLPQPGLGGIQVYDAFLEYQKMGYKICSKACTKIK